MGYPDFLCIGARKAGTTWLHLNLQQHPRVWVPPQKELHYFDHRSPWLGRRLFGGAAHLRRARANLRHAAVSLGRGGSLSELRWAARVCLLPRSDRWYRSLFPSGFDGVTGEVCPGYARMDDAAVASVARRMPRARIIYFLRDPIDCAWSSASSHFAKKRGGVGVGRAAPADIEHYLGKEHTVGNLRFARNLATWERHFPREQIFLSFYDELRSDPRQVFEHVLAFLGVDGSDAGIPPEIERKRGSRVRRQGGIPARYLCFLARLHIDGLVELDRQLSNAYTARWLAHAREALAGGLQQSDAVAG